MSQSSESKKSNGKPTVEDSGETCSLCDKTSDTVVLKSTLHNFKAVVCPDHMFAMLRKWKKQQKPPNVPMSKTA